MVRHASLSLNPSSLSSGDASQQALPLWQVPKAWLQLLVNDDEWLEGGALQNLMATCWPVCEAVLQCLQKHSLIVEVCRGLWLLMECMPHNQFRVL
jgi:hypothetical protein